MTTSKISLPIRLVFILLLGITPLLKAQKVYQFSTENKQGQEEIHRIFVDDQYFIESVFIASPATFISTKGGFYKKEENTYLVNFEFNSDFEKDGLKSHSYTERASWKLQKETNQALKGKWLMGGRINEEGLSRRDTSGTRKTMKVLFNDYFQWIAFDTASMKFSGTGGGKYLIDNGKYTEHIEYFSRDNSRVGAELSFDYEIINGEWHHKGLSSKGDPFHEIWIKRR
ncbi:membrane or secreted protein [uncultured Arcticibacterium sp.]|uniref:membrane or secreted protein n=1 Tax=uncultured Arcticibacterium sp. TaxID=2173042 RepID=UPI0030FB5BF2